MRYTVLLEDGTIGSIDSDTIDEQGIDKLLGAVVWVHLQDENGNFIEVEGKLLEVLEESLY